MSQIVVPALSLKDDIETYVKMVRNGAIVILTYEGETIGRIVPELGPAKSPEEFARRLRDAGISCWGGGKLKDIEPVAKLKPGGKTLAEIVSELRD